MQASEVAAHTSFVLCLWALAAPVHKWYPTPTFGVGVSVQRYIVASIAATHT